MLDSNRKNAKILIVDDQQANIDILIEWLTFQGYSNIKTTTNPRMVVGIFQLFEPDIVLLDLKMPHLSGMEVLGQLNILTPPSTFLPVIVITADITDEAKNTALASGAHDFITKPYYLVEVGLRVDNLLKTRYLHQQLENMNLLLEKKVHERTYELEQTNIKLIAAKEKAEEADRLKTTFLLNFSHEIKTPMSGIQGFIEIMKKDNTSEADKKLYLDIINESSTRLMNLVVDLVDISMIQTSTVELDLEEFNINDRLQVLYKTFLPEATAKGIVLKQGNLLADNACMIYNDKIKIIQVITKLIKNAIKFTSQGEIEFGCFGNTDSLEFYVKDTGIGIKPETAEVIYDRFRQGDEGLSRNYPGAGLGLSISKAFVEQMGGKLWHSANSPQGSIFHFILPKRSA